MAKNSNKSQEKDKEKEKAPVVPEAVKQDETAPKGGTDLLEDVSNEKDVILNEVAKGVIQDELAKQRGLDAKADHEDSYAGAEARKKAKAEQNRELKEKALLEDRGPVLVGGRTRVKVEKRVQELEPDPKGKTDENGEVILVPKRYENYPIQTIEGYPVQFVASNSIMNKSNTWDEGFTDGYFHFTECGHPMYDNSVCTEIIHENHDKLKKRGYVIKTNEEIQLFLVK